MNVCLNIFILVIFLCKNYNNFLCHAQHYWILSKMIKYGLFMILYNVKKNPVCVENKSLFREWLFNIDRERGDFFFFQNCFWKWAFYWALCPWKFAIDVATTDREICSTCSQEHFLIRLRLSSLSILSDPSSLKLTSTYDPIHKGTVHQKCPSFLWQKIGLGMRKPK